VSRTCRPECDDDDNCNNDNDDDDNDDGNGKSSKGNKGKGGSVEGNNYDDEARQRRHQGKGGLAWQG
jgi:hypothetical protein